MKRALKQGLVWTPRILGILFAVFLNLFALDVFGEDHGFWKTILTLLIHFVQPASSLLRSPSRGVGNGPVGFCSSALG